MPRASFVARLGAFAVALILLSLAFSTAITYRRSRANLARSLAAELLAVVQSTAPLLDGDLHQLVSQGADGTIAGREEFELLRAELLRVRDANGLVGMLGGSPLYTMRKAGDFATTGELEFVVMTDPAPATGAYFTGNRYRPEPFNLAALAGTSTASAIYADAEGTWISASAPIRDSAGHVVGILQADRPVGFFLAAARREALMLVGAAAAALFIAIPCVIWFARSVARPIRALAEAAEGVGAGQLRNRVDDSRGDELGDLGRSFNAMAAQLHEAQRRVAEQMSELTAARDLAETNERAARRLAEEQQRIADLKSRLFTQVSHQFRTPLTIVLGAAQVLQRYGSRLTDDDRTKRLDRIVAAVTTLEQLIDAVLTFDRPDAAARTCLRVPVDVVALGREVVAEFAATASATHELTLQAASARTVADVDPLLMRRIMKCLVSNAVSYSPPDSPVRIALTCDDSGVELSVSDHGPGIAPEDQASIFEPFCRGTETEHVAGFGLGLALAQHAAAAHGGSITVDSTPGHGATFTVRLPAAPA